MNDITEDYYKAQKDRRIDFFKILHAKRRGMAMHLGGVYIECLLKGLIIKKYGILKSKRIEIGRVRYYCWYSNKVYLEIQAISDPTKQDYIDRKSAKNPQHDLMLAIEQLEELYNTIPSDVLEKLRTINRPIGRKSYIDIRYMSEDEISNQLYSKWEESFKGFLNYYEKRKKLFSFK